MSQSRRLRWKTPSRQTAALSRAGSLVVIDKGRPAMGVPIVSHGKVRGTPTTSFSLVGGSF
jgi:hypothetical protein